MATGEGREQQELPYVSTGLLPPVDDVRSLVDEAYRRYSAVGAGEVSDVYPALTRAAPGLFGVCVAAVDGRVHAAGDAEVGFTIMSVAKPFTFALVCDALGPDEIQMRVGVNATGLPFNAVEAVERSEDGRTNPMVNPGAIATASLAPGRGRRREVAVRVGRALALRRPSTRARRRGVRLGLGHEPPEPGARPPPGGSMGRSAPIREMRSTSTRDRAVSG